MLRSLPVEANREQLDARSEEPKADPCEGTPLHGEPDAPSSRRIHLDRDGWSAAFRAHRHHVIVSLIAAGVRADRAVDLAQAAWTRVIEQDRAGKLAELRLPGIVVAQARLLALEDRRRRRDYAIEQEEELESDATDPEKHALDREQMERALAIVAAAAPTAQRVFRLVYGDPPVAHERAAAEVGLSLQRVRQILCELRAKIRDALDGEEGGGR